VTYEIVFVESGLPMSAEWWVNLTAGRSTSSVGSSLSFIEPNGTYFYSVATLDKEYSSHGGTLAVGGLNLSEAITFSSVNYTVSFTESGLPSGTGWWVNVTGGPSAFSTGELVSFGESNGSFEYSAATTNLNFSSPEGFVEVEGSPVFKVVTFSLVAYPVTFTEVGLPSGTSWSVTFRDTRLFANENLAFWAIPNGTYGFTVGAVPGYTANPTAGTVQVRGAGVSVPITFAAKGAPRGNGTNPPTFLGLPSTEGYAVLGGTIVVILAVIAAALLLWRGGSVSLGAPKQGLGKPPACP
jgi:hypothetical protein